MKKLFSRYTAVLAVGFVAASVALAGMIDVPKINKTIAGIVKKELVNAKLLSSLKIAISQDTAFDAHTSKFGINFSAGAKKSAWSNVASTFDVGVNLNTLPKDDANSTIKGLAKISSKTDSLSLYRYVAKKLVDSANQDGEQPKPGFESDLALLLVDATNTMALETVVDQLERLRSMLVHAATDPSYGGKGWEEVADVMKSLKVNVAKDASGSLTSVEITTTIPYMFDAKTALTQIGFKLSKTDWSLKGGLSADMSKENVAQYAQSISQFLMALQSDDADTLKGIGEMARDYIQMAEDVLSGKTK